MDDTKQWWQRPFRTFQTNLREIDAGLDVTAVLDHIIEVGATSWLLNTGGIVSFYPSQLPFQHPSPWLAERASGDLIGDAITAAHERGVRVISRLDFSKVHRDVAEEHPDWCFVSPAGQPQVYNELHSTCPSGPYYQQRAFEILDEIISRYPVDGFFFNWFGFNVYDYSRRYHGICQCTHCRHRFAGRFDAALPTVEDWSDPRYGQWLRYTEETLADLAGRIRAFIGERRSDAALILSHNPDVAFYEANNAVDRAQPLWIYGTGEFIRASRTTQKELPVWVNSVMFLDLGYRFTVEQPGMLGLYFAQTLAHGGNLSAYMVGTPSLFASSAFDIVREVFRFQQDHEEYYTDIRSAARVAVVSSRRSEREYGGATGTDQVRDELRGVFRALLESHVPFDLIRDERLVDFAESGALDRYDALVLPNVAILDDPQLAVLDAYVEGGGGLVATYDTGGFTLDGRPRPELGLRSLGAEAIIARRDDGDQVRSAYLREATGPDTSPSGLILLDRGFLHVSSRPGATSALSFVPPSRYGPPEKCYPDIETQHPGLLSYGLGTGSTAYFPWPVGALYERLSLPEHRALLINALDEVSRGPRQVRTDAPPHVEVVVTTQPEPNRTLVHVINYSGHRGRWVGDPLPIRDVTVRLDGLPPVSRVQSTRQGHDLTPVREPGTGFVLPELGLFDLIVLEHATT